MQSKLDPQIRQQLKTVLAQMVQQGVYYEQILLEVKNLMNELGGEAQASEQRADEILDMIKNTQSAQSDGTRLKEFLERLEKDETRH